MAVLLVERLNVCIQVLHPPLVFLRQYTVVVQQYERDTVVKKYHGIQHARFREAGSSSEK